MSVEELLRQCLPVAQRAPRIAALEALAEGELLSFRPQPQLKLSHQQELELRFFLSLLAVSEDLQVLKKLLRGLNAPYHYDLERLRYDWGAQRWRYWAPTETSWPQVERWLGERADAGDAAAIYSALERSARHLRRLALQEQEP